MDKSTSWSRTVPGSSPEVTISIDAQEDYHFEILALLRYCLTQHFVLRDEYPTRVFRLPLSVTTVYITTHVLMALIERVTPEHTVFLLRDVRYHHVSTLTTGFTETVPVYTRLCPGGLPSP
jgi:hypothetical protein